MKNDMNHVIINCPFYEKNQSLLMESKRKINQTNRPIEKSIYAEDVETYANNLLTCSDFDNNREECQSCHQFALRQKHLVIHFLGEQAIV
ncbi:MAG: hypothetical protein EOM06_07925 [Sphingobacteriia bacterium]|nr:hypothetical protein [Sphingobacteriia bacterium]